MSDKTLSSNQADNQWRRDPISGQWVIISQERGQRPGAFAEDIPLKNDPENCPFCEGHESETPAAVYESLDETAQHWRCRVFPNKFPAVKSYGELSPDRETFYCAIPGTGVHEVIIESPEHVSRVSELSLKNLEQAFRVYLMRILNLREHEELESVSVFKNVGSLAGASIFHTHSQLLASPMVPEKLKRMLQSCADYYQKNHECVFCRLATDAKKLHKTVIAETENYLAYCPFASRLPYEVRIQPKHHQSHFEATEVRELAEIAELTHQVCSRLEELHSDLAYNYVIQTGTLKTEGLDSFHWHLEILPRLTKIAGFELGTGFFVNLVAPELAAEQLRA